MYKRQLWKAAKPGEPAWESPWGMGRPGWHIECSAMSRKYLGLPFDIHGGGADLVFPHHENERAQSEAACGCTFANYWMHGGMLQINSEKMSKSLGNFKLLRDVLKVTDPKVLRFLMLQTHYRSPLDFSDERLAEAGAALCRIENAVKNLDWQLQNAQDIPSPLDTRELMKRTKAAKLAFILDVYKRQSSSCATPRATCSCSAASTRWARTRSPSSRTWTWATGSASRAR